MGFLLIDARFDFPALMIAVDELEGRSLLRVQQGRDQAMQLTRIGVVACLRRGELGESRGDVRLDAILDHAHLHSRQPHRMQGDQVAAIGEHLLGMGELPRFEACQGVSLLLMDQCTQLCGGADAAIHQDEHTRLHRAGEQHWAQALFGHPTGGEHGIDDGMGAHFR